MAKTWNPEWGKRYRAKLNADPERREKRNARHRAYMMEYRKVHQDRLLKKAVDNRRKRMGYYISDEEHDRLLAEQGGKCRICKGDQVEGIRVFAVDHDHVTMQIRGLLCNRCNAGLGNFRDDPELLKEAVTYLEYYKSIV